VPNNLYRLQNRYEWPSGTGIDDRFSTSALKDFVKINVDAAVDANLLEGTTAAVIRDSFGNFVATKILNLSMFMMQCQRRHAR
jgi:hypothetical protein